MASEMDTNWISIIKSGWTSNFSDASLRRESNLFNVLNYGHTNASDSLHYAPASALDSIISDATFGALNFIGIDINHVSPVTKDLPFVRSPTPVILSVAAYLLVVFLWSMHIKAAGLKPRKEEPNALKYLIIMHNLFLCGLSLFMGSGIVWVAWSNGWSIWGNAINETDYAMSYLIYIFYISKIYEFMDTVIMLLRRNLRQVSYLHVYHHASISIIWWLLAYRFPGGDAYFSAAFNSWIHVIMYLYYLLAATVAKGEKLRKKYLFWGKYLTMLQMFQFVSFASQAAYGMIYPDFYPKGVPRLLFFYSLSLLMFFGDFFIKKYCTQAKTKSNKLD